MSHDDSLARLSRRDMEAILAVTRALAAPYDLPTMLGEVSAAARRVLHAERSSVWLYDPVQNELVLQFGTDLQHVRIPASRGLLGACIHDRKPINVPDCYADPRFDQSIDRLTGFHTRCSLTLPLIDHNGELVGAMQILNKQRGVFEATDVALAQALAAQCAVALTRVRMTETMLEGKRLQQELELARVVQMSTLPSIMPTVEGYDVFGSFRPANLTGGDTFDLAAIDQGLLVMLGDATGHGIAPALDVTQMHAMLRMAFRMGADLETALIEVNNQLAETLPDDRFITAFVGVLDIGLHRLRFHSAGQAPLLFFAAASGSCTWLGPTSFPLAAMPLRALRPAVTLEMQPGDIFVLLSDGIYEYHNAQGEQFGTQRVGELIMAHRDQPVAALSALLLDAVTAHAAGAPQADDITVVLVKRRAVSASVERAFERRIDVLPDIFGFTAAFAATHGIAATVLQAVDFTIEELFTNMVKYSTMSRAAVQIALTSIAAGMEVSLVDHDVDRFDVTAAPDVDIHQPVEQRSPGGLGLHLIRRMVDAIEYRYDPDLRQSHTIFRKSAQP